MAANRVEWTIYATEAKAREVHTFMLGRAAQARVLNAGLPTAEPGGGDLHEMVEGVFQLRERFIVTAGGAVQDAPIADQNGPLWRSTGFSVYEDVGWAADALAQCQALAQQAALLITQPDPQPFRPIVANSGSIHVCGHETGEPCVISDSWTVAIPAAPSTEPWASAWVQPTGAHDAYGLGDIVTHNGQTWESTNADNVWEPGVFGWVIYE